MSVLTTKTAEVFGPLTTGAACVVNNMKTFSPEQIAVYVDGDANDIAVLGVDYTLLVALDYSGVTVTPLAPLVARAATITVARVTPFTSNFDVAPNGRLLEGRLVEQLDRGLMREQENAGALSRALRLPPGDAAIPTLPGLAARKGKFLYFSQESGAPVPVDGVAEAKLDYAETTTEISAASVLTAVTSLTTKGYYTVGDGGGGRYVRLAAAPASPRGWHFQSLDGAWWELDSIEPNVLQFGAKGSLFADGVGAAFDALPAFIEAEAYARGKGGLGVHVPAIGKAYCFKGAGTLTLGNGVVFYGDRGAYFAGDTATPDEWASSGSWIWPTHATNPAIVLQGHGSGHADIHGIYDQPEAAPGWTPNAYGYFSSRRANHTTRRRCIIVNGWCGIETAFGANGGGVGCVDEDMVLSCFKTRVRTSMVNDVMRMDGLDLRNLWRFTSAYVRAYIRANTYAWDCGYTDNPQMSRMQIFEDRGIYFRDETCLGNTHSLYNGQLSSVQFSLGKQAMQVENAATHVLAVFTDVIAQAGNQFGETWSDTMFLLGSDNVDLTFNGFRLRDAGGTIMNIGGGTGGRVTITGADIDQYSTVAAGQTGFIVNAGADLTFPDRPRIRKPVSAGARFAGAGSDRVVTGASDERSFFRSNNEYTFPAGNGAWQYLSADNNLRCGLARIHQVRLVAQAYVQTPQPGATLRFRMANIAAVLTPTAPATTVSWQSVDTGWVDVTEAEFTGLSTLGRLEFNASTGVVLQNGAVQMFVR